MPNNGFRDLERHLKKIAKDIEKQSEEEVPVQALLNEAFMEQYTEFNSFDAFLEALPDGSFEDMLANQRDMVDTFVNEKTNFESWDAMLYKAGEIYMAKKLKKLF
ncbi:hypothetical protein [Paenibacillus sp. HJGM_3]|uniref:hypothetical protein n=1 Tax=Paenibacillus sp. HJGM_3 TaxID=3379816 RepID=UPI0038590406